MYEAYKDSTNDFKRTCAYRSIDSDLETDWKKVHVNDSSASLTYEHKEGEVNEL